jgi:manganese transport protein
VRASAVLGPAFVAAIAYVDPGNFATNFQGGASFGYQLMWVVLLANLVAMPIQFMSAKLGIVTGKSLPRLCRESLPRSASWAMWGQAEMVAMATDIAEFVGAAVGLNLLFHMPIAVAAVVTAGLSFGVLRLQRRGHRPFEIAIGCLLALVCAGFLYETLRIGPSATGAVAGLVPHLSGNDSVLLAVGIVGATVMPHAIYLHSGLTGRRIQPTNAADRRRVLRLEKIDVAVALGAAGLVNLSMLALAAKVFHGHAGPIGGVTIASMHTRLAQTAGGGAALAFAAALLASGLSASSVGTCAGQVIMDGFIDRRIAPWARRLLTMAPAIILLCAHVDPTRMLILSQVALSFGVPFALIPLLKLSSNRTLMGENANGRLTVVYMTVTIIALSGLNALLLYQTFAT